MVKFPAPSTRPCRKIFLDFLGMVKFAVSDLGAVVKNGEILPCIFEIMLNNFWTAVGRYVGNWHRACET